ncbi:tRNA uridine-5-carboxymethylaminomethyl(34) synthesis GTPase MnmE [Oecophyllibacter saccharovorans]|uniref:tRNA uridine-5-carboxymethylaminomethyl(34) synthesis GTPase MnmE n=1 Tax=Oecophyllibacter saccharovorans TaxID=2558360 RepID=UPI0011711512|nr:tRNA uridine-5-carboxymethylaminomethyl(34) synthesis GTPase MnmE [Oecophyllibacter saccharovorans]TPW33723.1 tRNA uridine-5-carboxymethylaminomethyl(34) synthesis GTPase MnmE [Oecophyllibacter saccharovorans]
MSPTDPSVIFALATAPGGAISVMRASGPGSAEILQTLAGTLPAPRRASLRPLKHGGEVLDEALVLWFPGPSSYTGEDSFELHLHGSPAIIEAVAEALRALGACPAEAGAFTRRAVQAGRMDLLQAEAIADLVEAETQAQRRQALRQADGALSALYDGWAGRLKQILAQQEALIDFPDEELPPEVENQLMQNMLGLQVEIAEHLQDRRGEATREGLHVVIAGAPNAGKSSLLNALSGTDAAIVTAHAGTTRDAISLDWTFEGLRLRLTDTAGLRKTENEIEAEGIRRARTHVSQADLVLHLLAPGEEATPSLTPEALRVRTKTDLAPLPAPSAALTGSLIGINTVTPDGLAPLLAALRTRLQPLLAQREAPPLTRARHRAGLEETQHALTRALKADWPELRGEELRQAMRALGRLTGKVDVEALLDTIFSSFCIGK